MSIIDSNIKSKKSRESHKSTVQTYAHYKDSGVEWLGEIPEHWKKIELKRLIKNNDGGIWNDNIADNGIPVYRSTEINIDGSWGKTEPIKLILSEKELEKVKLKYGDLIVVKSSGSPEHIGKTAIYKTNDIAAYSNFTQRIRFKNDNNPNYYFYVLNSDVSKFQYKVLTKSTSGLGNLNAEILGNIFTINPPLSEQTAIANFLDDKTEKIDRAISIKEQQIALLKERKQILIHNAVTKGIRPLSEVEMKDSGVEWIGEIPEHWEVRRFKFLCHITTGSKNTEDKVEDGLYPFYVRSQTPEKINSYTFDGEAILTAGDGAGVGKVFHYIDEKFDFHQRVYKFSDFKDIKGKLLFFYLRSNFHNVALTYPPHQLHLAQQGNIA